MFPGKIEGNVPPQSTAAKNRGQVPPRFSEAPMIKPFRISKANLAYASAIEVLQVKTKSESKN